MRSLFAKGIVHRDLKPQNILLSHNCKTLPPPAKITLKIGKLVFTRKETFLNLIIINLKRFS